MRRHPILLVICLALTVMGSVGVYSTLPTRYQDQASLVLLPPGTVPDDKGVQVQTNPLQRAGDGPAQIAASALVLIGSSPAFQAQLATSGVTSKSLLQVSADGGGVIIDVLTTSKSAAATSKDIPIIVDALKAELAREQKSLSAPTSTYYDLQNLTSAGLPASIAGGKTKTAGVAGIAGIIVTLMVILAYDWRLRRRRGQTDPIDDDIFDEGPSVTNMNHGADTPLLPRRRRRHTVTANRPQRRASARKSTNAFDAGARPAAHHRPE